MLVVHDESQPAFDSLDVFILDFAAVLQIEGVLDLDKSAMQGLEARWRKREPATRETPKHNSKKKEPKDKENQIKNNTQTV